MNENKERDVVASIKRLEASQETQEILQSATH
jgi:hypothetical protein